MKYLALTLVALALTGCGKFDQLATTYTGDPAKICVDGVTYLQFTSGATVQVDVTGRPVACVKK